MPAVSAFSPPFSTSAICANVIFSFLVKLTYNGFNVLLFGFFLTETHVLKFLLNSRKIVIRPGKKKRQKSTSITKGRKLENEIT